MKWVKVLKYYFLEPYEICHFAVNFTPSLVNFAIAKL
jgi:hypothetical protein